MSNYADHNRHVLRAKLSKACSCSQICSHTKCVRLLRADSTSAHRFHKHPEHGMSAGFASWSLQFWGNPGIPPGLASGALQKLLCEFQHLKFRSGLCLIITARCKTSAAAWVWNFTPVCPHGLNWWGWTVDLSRCYPASRPVLTVIGSSWRYSRTSTYYSQDNWKQRFVEQNRDSEPESGQYWQNVQGKLPFSFPDRPWIVGYVAQHCPHRFWWYCSSVCPEGDEKISPICV